MFKVSWDKSPVAHHCIRYAMLQFSVPNCQWGQILRNVVSRALRNIAVKSTREK